MIQRTSLLAFRARAREGLEGDQVRKGTSLGPNTNTAFPPPTAFVRKPVLVVLRGRKTLALPGFSYFAG